MPTWRRNGNSTRCYHLDLNAEKYDSSERLYAILERHLNLWEDRFGKDTREETLSAVFPG